MSLVRNSRASATGPGDRPKLLLIAALATTLGGALAARLWLPPDALLPVTATIVFALAAAAALASWLRRAYSDARLDWLDFAGILTCIGILVSLMIEPEALAPFVETATRGK